MSSGQVKRGGMSLVCFVFFFFFLSTELSLKVLSPRPRIQGSYPNPQSQQSLDESIAKITSEPARQMLQAGRPVFCGL